MTTDQVIELYGMKQLPGEGGWYVETYRAAQQYGENHSLATTILYLLTRETFSALHRLASDEVYHFYLGNPVTMLQLGPGGSSKVFRLGHDIQAGQQVQVIVPAQTWQGSFVAGDGKWALMGCTVAPGFEFADYEQARREQLLEEYPEQRELILRLTWE
jgi:predicted cupin superfamily sugar epimerase